MNRFFDLLLALAAAVILAIPVLLVAVAVRLTSPGPACRQRQSLVFDSRILWLTLADLGQGAAPRWGVALMRRLLIVGAGGHGRSVAVAVCSFGRECLHVRQISAAHHPTS